MFPSSSYDAWKTTEPSPDGIACTYCNTKAVALRGNEPVCAECGSELDEPDWTDEDELEFRHGAEIDRQIDEARGK